MTTDNSARDSVPYLLGQLTAKVDVLLSNQKATNERHEVLENRVTILEKDKAKILGGVIVLSSIATYGLNYIIK